MKRILLAALLLLCASLAFSVDFGLLLDEKFEAENSVITSTTGFTPWFSWDGGNGLSLYLSALVSLRYSSADNSLGIPVILPEVSRFSLSYRINQRHFIEVGRIPYTDVLGVTAAGLFDGARYEAALGGGTLNAGVYYTGLQFKDTAKIKMSAADNTNYGDPRNIQGINDYFASQRLFIAGRWDMPLGDATNMSVEALAQFDLNGSSEDLHSQYAEAQFELFTTSKIGLTAGAFLEAMEKGGAFFMAFGALGVLRINLPTPINDMLRFSAKFSSGDWGGALAPFTPLSAHGQGQIFSEPFSGLCALKLSYEARILRSLFADAAFSYYIKTYSDKNLYGGEIYASLAWQPLDDIRVYAGGGVFIPGMGNIYPPDTVDWKVSAGITLSF